MQFGSQKRHHFANQKVLIRHVHHKDIHPTPQYLTLGGAKTEKAVLLITAKAWINEHLGGFEWCGSDSAEALDAVWLESLAAGQWKALEIHLHREVI